MTAYIIGVLRWRFPKPEACVLKICYLLLFS